MGYKRGRERKRWDDGEREGGERKRGEMLKKTSHTEDKGQKRTEARKRRKRGKETSRVEVSWWWNKKMKQ